MEENLERVKFPEVLSALQDQSRPFPTRLLRGFSDLSEKDLKGFAELWSEIPLQRRRSLLEDLEDLTENDTLVCFDEMARVVLDDPDPSVRVLAIRLLWECENAGVIPAMVEMLRGDEDEGVRATAASLLGRFVYLGELEEIPDAALINVVRNLLEVVNGEDLVQVRMRALESLGYSGNPSVPAIIRAAFESPDSLWVASSLCAMGRSADEQWAEMVLEKLDSEDAEILFEAVRAAGELELTDALDRLFALLEDEQDSEIRLAVIWSLSQIGGSEVKGRLRELRHESESNEEMEWIEKALDNLELNSGVEGLNFFNFKPGSVEEDGEAFDDDEEDEDDFDEDEFESLDEYEEDDDDEDDDR